MGKSTLIDHIFAAPKGEHFEQGLALARQQHLNFEIQLEQLHQIDDEMEKAQTMLRDFQGQVALAVPWSNLNLASVDPDIAQLSQQKYLKAIEVAKAFQIRYLILDSQWSPVYAAAQTTKQWLSKMTDFWEETIGTYLADSHLTILIENFMEPTPESLIKLMSRVNSPQFRVCFDTGHANIFSQCAPVDWLHDLGAYATYIHAHNNNGAVDSHDAFDKGNIDMDSFLNHIALLPQKFHVSINTNSIEALESSYTKLPAYLQLQRENTGSKNFLI